MTAGLHDRLVSLILDGNRSFANKLIDDWAAVHGYDKALIEVLNPVLEKIGQLWGSGVEFSLAQSYVAGKLAEDIPTKVAANEERTIEKRETKAWLCSEARYVLFFALILGVVISNIPVYADDDSIEGRKNILVFNSYHGIDFLKIFISIGVINGPLTNSNK